MWVRWCVTWWPCMGRGAWTASLTMLAASHTTQISRPRITRMWACWVWAKAGTITITSFLGTTRHPNWDRIIWIGLVHLLISSPKLVCLALSVEICRASQMIQLLLFQAGRMTWKPSMRHWFVNVRPGPAMDCHTSTLNALRPKIKSIITTATIITAKIWYGAGMIRIWMFQIDRRHSYWMSRKQCKIEPKYSILLQFGAII